MIQQEFSYSTQPHAAPVRRTNKYRSDGSTGGGGDSSHIQNIMYDPRVIRGSTYSAKLVSKGTKESEFKKGGTRRSNIQPGSSKRKFIGRNVSSPPPVEGRVHMNMQTDDFLEELTDRPIEIDAETQTQAFMDRPESPLFVKAKTGRDVETQIESGDLFDFDLEVEPILEILVGKTLHVSMLELMQEEELEAIRLQQEEFEAIRNVELAEVKRLEAEAKRKAEEKNRRLEQEKKRVNDRRELEEKIAARSFAYQYLGDLHREVFDMLEDEGAFYDPVKKEVEEVFMTQLLASLKKQTSCFEAAEALTLELLEAAREKAKVYEQEMKEKMRQWEAENQEKFEALEKTRQEELKKAQEAAQAVIDDGGFVDDEED